MKINSILRRSTAWFMLLIMIVNSLGNQVTVVHASGYDIEAYERASERLKKRYGQPRRRQEFLLRII